MWLWASTIPGTSVDPPASMTVAFVMRGRFIVRPEKLDSMIHHQHCLSVHQGG
jgi:hypothetical protein